MMKIMFTLWVITFILCLDPDIAACGLRVHRTLVKKSSYFDSTCNSTLTICCDFLCLNISCVFQLKKLVYVYLVRYAEEQQDLALLSISTFQRALKVSFNPKPPLLPANSFGVTLTTCVSLCEGLLGLFWPNVIQFAAGIVKNSGQICGG